MLCRGVYGKRSKVANRCDGAEVDNVAVVLKCTFNADGTVTTEGLMNSNAGPGNYTVLPSGLLYFGDETANGNTIVCGSTANYIKTHYTVDGSYDNVDLFFFDEAEAMVYAEALTESIPECETTD